MYVLSESVFILLSGTTFNNDIAFVIYLYVVVSTVLNVEMRIF